MDDPRDPLLLYRNKRDPAATNEPFEWALPRSGPTWVGDFVMHQHAASRMHYDLRLQAGGVLLSFAIPKGPSLDPEQKRLAVQTEDHPLSYFDFEDVIPEGSYGAGAMIVWDIGRVRYLENAAEDSVPKGKIDFELWGHKLQGRFALVETSGRMQGQGKQRQWLLLKKRDKHCKPDAEGPVEREPWSVFSGLSVEQLPERDAIEQSLIERVQTAPLAGWSFEHTMPMLCATEGGALNDARRIYELKLDGVRIWASRGNKGVKLRYRSGRAATPSYPDLVRPLLSLPLHDFVLDGEIVAFDERGIPDFQRLSKRFSATRPADVRRASIEVKVAYVVFDIIRVGGHDVTRFPLLERKRLLRELLPGKGCVRYLDHLPSAGQALFDWCRAQGLEGVVSKLSNSGYQFGPQRTGDWVKHRCEQVARFVVVGWVGGKGARGDLGSLEIATFRGEELIYRGRVGSGFSDADLSETLKKLRLLAISDAPCSETLDDVKQRTWVKPELVVEVRFLEWTNEGRIRHAVFVGFVATPPTECVAAPEQEILDRELGLSNALDSSAEQPLEQELVNEFGSEDWQQSIDASAASDSVQDQSKELSADAVQQGGAGARKVVLSNLNKVYWPDEGFTKGELLAYYEAIAPILLPQLRSRPVMLVRYPDGIKGKNFYQWNVPQGTPDWLRTLPLRNEERDGKTVTTFLLDDVDALLHIVNLGCIPIHVLACREQSLDHCDFVTIDFDLGPQPLQTAVILALSLKELLDDVGLPAYAKTSGQTGIHVLVPLPEGVPFAAAKMLVELVGHCLQLRHPDVSTMERRKEKRGDRVYIDTGQTGRSRTIVSPYSVRAHAGATVSTPLFWEEVHLALRPERYSMFTLPELVQRRGDPLATLSEESPDIIQALSRLERWVKRPR